MGQADYRGLRGLYRHFPLHYDKELLTDVTIINNLLAWLIAFVFELLAAFLNEQSFFCLCIIAVFGDVRCAIVVEVDVILEVA